MIKLKPKIQNKFQTVPSTETIQFTWAQERRVEEYIIRDKTSGREVRHVIGTSGWSLHDTFDLRAGEKYIFEVSRKQLVI